MDTAEQRMDFVKGVEIDAPGGGAERPVVRLGRTVREDRRDDTLRGRSRARCQPRRHRYRARAEERRGPRRILRRLLRPEAGGHEEGQRPPALRRGQSRPQGRARQVQQLRAGVGTVHSRGFRQRLPDAARLHHRVGRVAAGRAAPGRPDGARRAAGERRQRLRPLRAAPQQARGYAAARRPLSHSSSCGRSGRPAGADHDARAHGRRCRAGGNPALEVAFPGCVPRPDGRRLHARRALRGRVPFCRSPGRRAGLPRDTGHRRVAALGARRERQPAARARSSAPTSSACRRAGGFSATCCTWVSTRTSRAAWSSTPSCRTSPAAGAGSSTCASASLR